MKLEHALAIIFVTSINGWFIYLLYQRINHVQEYNKYLAKWARNKMQNVTQTENVDLIDPEPFTIKPKIFQKKPKVFNPRKDVDFVMSGKLVDPFESIDSKEIDPFD